MHNDRIIIHTDGSCSCNPGVGGWAAIIKTKEYETCVCGREQESTNNRMELKAFLEGLLLAENERIENPDTEIILYTDSKYVENPINNNWISRWVSNKFKNIKNVDLWVKIIEILMRTTIQIIWVPREKNKKADTYAKNARDGIYGSRAIIAI